MSHVLLGVFVSAERLQRALATEVASSTFSKNSTKAGERGGKDANKFVLTELSLLNDCTVRDKYAFPSSVHMRLSLAV